jgi:protoheme IX farnesyltransferase
MAIYATQTRRATDEMFIEAARALADQVTAGQAEQALIPPRSDIRKEWREMATIADTAAPAQAGTRLADYLQLTRPRLSAMALLTVAAGAVLASGGAPDWRVLTNTLIGAALVAAGASALNQLLERDSDRLMQRTRERPLPSGRLRPGEAFVFGFVSAVGGVVYLALTLPRPLAASLASLTLVSYLCVYTPLKRTTALNTLVGAIPGALPPVIGWAAVRGSLGAGAGVLFVVLFLWQVPHFLAIAWIHRADYNSARLRMLPATDPEGGLIGQLMVCYCLALLAASLAPLFLGGGGPVYVAGALLLGIGFVTCAVGFAQHRSVARARVVLRASLIYLPALLMLLLWAGIPH